MYIFYSFVMPRPDGISFIGEGQFCQCSVVILVLCGMMLFGIITGLVFQGE